MADITAAAQEAGTVGKAGAADLPRMAAALGWAFEADPATTWVVPDDAQRRRLLERAFLLFL
jgi:hypothetical protein